MTLDYEPSTPEPPNHYQLIDSDDEMETSEKLLITYYEAKIDHNHPNFHMIWEILKEERQDLRTIIDLLNKYKLP